MTLPSPFLVALIQLVRNAGAEILKLSRTRCSITEKSDGSPVTSADLVAQEILMEGLSKIAPNLPIISEELPSALRPLLDPEDSFFLVDPLDGTKEFIAGSPHFTINIARIENHQPVFGIIFAPAVERLFFGSSEFGAFEIDTSLAEETTPLDHAVSLPKTLSTQQRKTAILSHTRYSEKEKGFLQEIGIERLIFMGSSMKFCELSAGNVQVYPRFGSTYEWDTAAGQAILQAAGGLVLTEEGTPLTYGKRQAQYKNPHFIAWSHSGIFDSGKNQKKFF